MEWLMKALTWLGALIAGAVFGMAGTISYASLDVGVPLGFLVAALSCLGLLLAVRLLSEDRGAVLAAGAGMLLALFLFSGRGPGGSVVVPQAAEGELPLGIMWTIALSAIVLLVVAWPDFRKARAAHAAQVERVLAAERADEADTASEAR